MKYLKPKYISKLTPGIIIVSNHDYWYLFFELDKTYVAQAGIIPTKDNAEFIHSKDWSYNNQFLAPELY